MPDEELERKCEQHTDEERHAMVEENLPVAIWGAMGAVGRQALETCGWPVLVRAVTEGCVRLLDEKCELG